MSREFIVLGMHRSATSTVAGGLEKMGINIGNEKLVADEWNENGYFENVDFVKLNDSILRSAGGSWDNPPSRDNILKQREFFEDKIKEVINKNKKKSWGWKDPRTTLTIELYLPYLESPFFITCFRDTTEVAQSLHKRDGMLLEKGIALAEIYNKRLIDFLKNRYAIL